MSDIHPFELRDRLQKPCEKCGKPTVQQYVPASHRGNFQHGGSKLTVRPIGEVCNCLEREIAAHKCRSLDALTDPEMSREFGLKE